MTGRRPIEVARGTLRSMLDYERRVQPEYDLPNEITESENQDCNTCELHSGRQVTLESLHELRKHGRER